MSRYDPPAEISTTAQTESDVPDKERPQADDPKAKRPAFEDVGPHTPIDELVLLIQKDQLDHSRATFKGFCANVRTIIHLHWLHANIATARKQRNRGATIGGAEYLAAAMKAGVKRTMAYEIVRSDLYSHLDEIWRQAEIEAKQWCARTGHDTYRYPTLTNLISRYRLEIPAALPAEDDNLASEEETEGEDAPHQPNQTRQHLSGEVLRLKDALTTAQRQLERAREDFRQERTNHDADIDHFERRLELKEQRIAYLEGRLAVLGEPQHPTSSGQEDEAPDLPVLTDRGLVTGQVKEQETRHDVRPWRGPMSHARQLRADFLIHLTSLGLAAPPQLPASPGDWLPFEGQPMDKLRSNFGLPEPSQSSEAPTASQTAPPEPSSPPEHGTDSQPLKASGAPNADSRPAMREESAISLPSDALNQQAPESDAANMVLGQHDQSTSADESTVSGTDQPVHDAAPAGDNGLATGIEITIVPSGMAEPIVTHLEEDVWNELLRMAERATDRVSIVQSLNAFASDNPDQQMQVAPVLAAFYRAGKLAEQDLAKGHIEEIIVRKADQ